MPVVASSMVNATWGPSRGVLAVTLWAFFLETFLYGLYVFLFAFGLYVHWCYAQTRSGDRKYRSGVVVVALALSLFALLTAHWIMSFIRFYEGFVARGSTPMGSIVYFGELGTSLWVAQLAVYAVGRVLMDALLVVRLSVFWNSRFWIIALPTITVIGDLVASAMNCYYATQFAGFESKAFILQSQWITAAYSFSCFTNFISSSLIVYRVISKNRALREFNIRTSLAPFMAVIIESASLYTSLTIVLFILFKVRSPGVTVVLGVVVPLMGIVYSLITIQIGKGFTFLGASQLNSGLPAIVEIRAVDDQSTGRTTPITVPGRGTPVTVVPLEVLRHAPSDGSLAAKAKASLELGQAV